MRLELFAQRRRRTDRRLVQVRHVRRRIGRRRIEQVVENPLAAEDRRRAGRVRRHRQHAGVREDAGTRRIDKLDAAEPGSAHAGDPVMPREPLVEEGVFRVEEVEDAPILLDHILDEVLRLAAHRHPQVIVEVGKPLAIAGQRLERAKLEPLAAELLRERA